MDSTCTMNSNEYFSEFMREYIEIQPTQDEPPWCMSIEMLTHAYETFLMFTQNKVLMQDNAVYKLLRNYMSDNPSNITLLGCNIEHNHTPNITVTGIRLKKVPQSVLNKQ